jgi:hypothetical protein
MPVQHTRASVPHDRADLVAHLRFEAVNRAIDASGLIIAKRAAHDALLSVGPHSEALIAMFTFPAVVPAAVQFDHHADSP